MDEFLQQLQNPPSEYRPVPFWSWNDRLDVNFLRWQIGQMKQAGMGGYFMHARSGLETEYLGTDWMECVAACADEGKRLGMGAWLYDEDGWPSGFAGGRVPALGDEYLGRWLVMKRLAPGEAAADKNLLGVYCCEAAGGSVRRAGEADIGAERLAVSHRANAYYIDVMSEKAVRAFLQVTHQRYFDEMKGRVGSAIKGFFTDEPRLSGNFEGDIPWSYDIPDRFRAAYGYDVRDVLPALFIRTRDYAKVRYDFWKLVSELFVSSYIDTIEKWCRAHGCALTGHIMMEESVFTQMTGSGGVMPFYEHMDMPGVDWLRRYIGNPVVPKQVGSVACQTGKTHVLTESYALCGWNVNFEELKWIAEWQFVNGVNRICQHLEGYTLRGQRKRDYPPSLFIQQSWWKEYHRFNDYLARLGLVLTQGTEVAPVLLLHPMRSGWITYEGGLNDAIGHIDNDFARLSEFLSGRHIGYHYGDETIMAEHAQVEGARLIVGCCTYTSVVMPSMAVIASSTLELLQRFAANGGRIFCRGDFPALCDGRSDERLAKLQSQVETVPDDESLAHALRKLIGIRIAAAGKEAASIHCQHRSTSRGEVYFLVNLDNRSGYETTVTVEGGGEPRLLDLETVAETALPFERVGRSVRFTLQFLPMQSYVVVVAKADAPKASRPIAEPVISVRPGPEWQVETMDDNSLTLDTCRCRIDGGEWSGPKAVIHLMDELLALRRSCDIELSFSFHTRFDQTKNQRFFLALEAADAFEIAVNGHPVPYADIGWWKDSSFKKVDIRPFVINGENEICLKRRFYQSQKVYDVLFGKDVYETEKNKLTYDVELESIYLVGDFGVVSDVPYTAGPRGALFTDGPFTVVDAPRTFAGGCFTTQGLTFFAGSMTVSQIVRVQQMAGGRVMLDLGRPDAAMVRVRLNGREVGARLWSPFRFDLTGFVHPGENRLEVELYASNRNLLGPHHHRNGELYSVGPDSFTGRWSWVEKDSEAVPSTAEQRRADYWRNGYCFVRFGPGDPLSE